MFQEHEVVVLARDVPEAGLVTGDVGTVVGVYPGGRQFEVEFMTAGGRTVAVLTLGAYEIRRRGGGEILHVREVHPRG